MNRCCVVYIILCISGILARDVKTIEDNKRLSDVDPLLEAVQLEQWDDEERPCLKATLAILHGVKNSTLWATWIWDSMQRPVGFLYGSQYQLGSFDQCMKPPWLNSHPHLRTQYCLADVYLTDTAPKKQTGSLDPYSTTGLYFNITSKYGRHLNVLTWGVCLPSMCSQGTVLKLVQAMVRTQHLHSLTPNPHITVDSCQHAGDPVEYCTEFYYFISLMLIIALVSMLATFLSGYATTSSMGSRLLSSFDLRRNWTSFISDSRNEIRTLNGMKFITTVFVIETHNIMFVNTAAVINKLDSEKDCDTALGKTFLGVDPILETFYFISGLLLVKGLMSGKQKNPLAGLVKRYIRVLCPLAITVFYFASAYKYSGSGPLWPRFSSEQQQVCRKNWWINLLTLPIFIRSTEICHLATWYIASDIHLAAVGSMLFYIYQKNRRLGKWLFLITTLITALIPAFVTYWYEVPVGIFYDFQKIRDYDKHIMFLLVHIKPYCRVVVYLFGMIMGYYMSFYEPEDYRNIISKNLSIVGAAIAIFILHNMARQGGLYVQMEYDAIEAGIFVILRKILWTIAICCLIVVCEYGYVPIVNDILRCKLCGPLSRLGYEMYLVHMVFVFRHIHSTRSPVTHDFIELTFNSIGIVFSIVPICLYLYLFVEAPAGNLVNCLFGSTKIQKRNAIDDNHIKIGVKSKTT